MSLINKNGLLNILQPKPRDYVWDLFFNPVRPPEPHIYCSFVIKEFTALYLFLLCLFQTPALYAAVDVVNDVLNAVKKHIEGSEEVGMINKKKLK